MTPLPVYAVHPRACGSGQYKGIAPSGVHPLIFQACSTKDGIDVATYEALSTRIGLNGLADLREMRNARDSWLHAEMFEADYQRELEAERRAVQAAAQGGQRRR